MYCIDEEYIEKNPTEKVKWQCEGRVLINTFTSEEIANMLNAYKFTTYLESRNKTIMSILIHGKGNKGRQVSISPLLKKYMIRYERIKSEYSEKYNLKQDNHFLSYRGEPLTVEAVERVVRIAGQRARVRKEIRCSPHTARHWYAQEQLRSDLDVYSVSRLLGHENITITKRYLQSIQDADIVDLSVKTLPLMNLQGGIK